MTGKRTRGTPWLCTAVALLNVSLALSVAERSFWGSAIIALLLLPPLALAVALAVLAIREHVPRDHRG